MLIIEDDEIARLLVERMLAEGSRIVSEMPEATNPTPPVKWDLSEYRRKQRLKQRAERSGK